jgi:hypothetical protein
MRGLCDERKEGNNPSAIFPDLIASTQRQLLPRGVPLSPQLSVDTAFISCGVADQGSLAGIGRSKILGRRDECA